VLYLVLIIAIVLDVLASMLAAAETSVMLLAPGRVHRLVEAEQPGALQLEALAVRPHRLRAASSLAAGAGFGASVVLGVVVGGMLPQIGGTAAKAAGGAAMLVIAFAVMQALPRTLSVANPERIGLGAAPFALIATRVLYPVARVLGTPWAWVTSLSNGGESSSSAWATGDEYRFAESDELTDREEAEEALLEAVSDFAEKVVREIMVPRTDMAALPDTATLLQAVALIQSSGFSRIPIYRGTVDDIRGVVYAKDLLAAAMIRDSAASVSQLARRPFFVPETKPVEELLVEMRTKTHIAIVADEYGGTAGLITLEDLLEEIVGEIFDEYDREEPLLTEISEGHYRVDARLPVDDLNELFGTDIDIDADSVGGLFTEVAGHIPVTGESLVIEGLTFTVEVTEGTRIRKLTVNAAEDNEGDHQDA